MRLPTKHGTMWHIDDTMLYLVQKDNKGNERLIKHLRHHGDMQIAAQYIAACDRMPLQHIERKLHELQNT